jgi:hypothetical protein
MKKSMLLLPMLFGCLALFSATYATTAVAGTWDIGGSPGAADDIIVNHDWLAYNSGALLNYTGTITINTGGKFTIDGDFTTNGATVDIGTGATLQVTGNSTVADEASGGSITLNGTWHVVGNLINNFNTWVGSGNLVVDGSFTENGDIGITTLPVELVRFDASYNQDGFVELLWVTASEVNSERFSIMRSYDGVDFIEIASLSAQGNSQELKTYRYHDANAMDGIAYYQLVEYDMDGSTQQSPITFVDAKASNEYAISSYPNPTSDALSILFKSDLGGKYTINVFNQTGQILYTDSIATSVGSSKIDLSLLALPSDIYNIQLIDSAGVISNVRVVKN